MKWFILIIVKDINNKCQCKYYQFCDKANNKIFLDLLITLTEKRIAVISILYKE